MGEKVEVWWRCQTCAALQRQEPELPTFAGDQWRMGRCQNLGCKSRKKSKTMSDMAQFRREEHRARA